MAYSEKKRFVAGAKCPRCEVLDKIVVYSQDGKDYRECVVCDYHEEMRFAPVQRELDTRVNQADVEEQPVQFINFPSSTKH